MVVAGVLPVDPAGIGVDSITADQPTNDDPGDVCKVAGWLFSQKLLYISYQEKRALVITPTHRYSHRLLAGVESGFQP